MHAITQQAQHQVTRPCSQPPLAGERQCKEPEDGENEKERAADWVGDWLVIRETVMTLGYGGNGGPLEAASDLHPKPTVEGVQIDLLCRPAKVTAMCQKLQCAKLKRKTLD